jgi:hypothetical protein
MGDKQMQKIGEFGGHTFYLADESRRTTLFSDLPRVSKPREVDGQIAETLLNRSGRRITTLQRVYDLLASGRPVSMRELAEITPRYGGRIYDLRQMGFVIDLKQRGDGDNVYRLRNPLK